jgi:hypothetical protein
MEEDSTGIAIIDAGACLKKREIGREIPAS